MELHEYLMDFKEYINTHLDLDRVPIILDNDTISLFNSHIHVL